jgi:hypothetical protein
MENFEKRKKELEKILLEKQKKLQVVLYAANIVLQNGEVQPVIKIADLVKKDDEIRVIEDADGDDDKKEVIK